MYKFLLYILLLICSFVKAQTTETIPEEEEVPEAYYDDEDYYDDIEEDVNYNRVSVSEYLSDPLNIVTNDSLTERNFKSKLNEKYTGEDFDYTKTNPKKSLWSKFKQKVEDLLSRIFSEADAQQVNKYTKIVLRIFAGILVTLGLYYLFKLINKKNGNLFFSKKDKQVNIYDTDIIEDINEIDFNNVIAQYELEKNYNSAFRYQFLAILKSLTDSNKIKWTQEKTNIDYLYELKDTEIKKQFERAVYIFNHVWYGDFKINQQDYKRYVEEIKPLKTNTYE